jgi:hypothetical protein
MGSLFSKGTPEVLQSFGERRLESRTETAAKAWSEERLTPVPGYIVPMPNRRKLGVLVLFALSVVRLDPVPDGDRTVDIDRIWFPEP